MPVMLDDFEADFDAAISALVRDEERRIAAIPPEKRADYFLASAARHLARMIELDAPALAINEAAHRLMARLRERQRAGVKAM